MSNFEQVDWVSAPVALTRRKHGFAAIPLTDIQTILGPAFALAPARLFDLLCPSLKNSPGRQQSTAAGAKTI